MDLSEEYNTSFSSHVTDKLAQVYIYIKKKKSQR